VHRLGIAVALVASALAGCANHVRYADEIRSHEKRDVELAATAIESRRPVLDGAWLELELSTDETLLVRRRETLVHLDQATPWCASEELWEVPAGLFMAPFFVAVRAVDRLNVIPPAKVDAGLDWGFSALNPALNIESDARLRGREISRETRELGRSEEHSARPLGGVDVSLALADAPAVHVRTDPAGRVHTDLLALAPDSLTTAPHALWVRVPADGPRTAAALELPIARAEATRLMQAVAARRAARAAGVTPESAGRAMAELDALGFSESALSLEHELRERQAQNAAWLARLDLALRDD
jgi:hypothetical protein